MRSLGVTFYFHLSHKGFLSPSNYFMYVFIFYALDDISDLTNYSFLPIKILLLHNTTFFSF